MTQLNPANRRYLQTKREVTVPHHATDRGDGCARTLRSVRTTRTIALGVLVACMSWTGATPAIAATQQPSVIVRTKALVAALMAVEQPAAKKQLSAAQKQHNAKTFAALDGFFDQQGLKTKPIAVHRGKLSAAQAKAFGEVFYPLLRLVAFPDSGVFLRKATRKLKRGKIAGDVVLHAEIEADDVDTDITFHWRQVDGALRVTDVSFDGASLMKSYSNQFGRIIKKRGVKGLISRLTKRLKEERRVRKALLP